MFTAKINTTLILLILSSFSFYIVNTKKDMKITKLNELIQLLKYNNKHLKDENISIKDELKSIQEDSENEISDTNDDKDDIIDDDIIDDDKRNGIKEDNNKEGEGLEDNNKEGEGLEDNNKVGDNKGDGDGNLKPHSSILWLTIMDEGDNIKKSSSEESFDNVIDG